MFTGVLALLSTIIGGGIVGLPYSYLIFGIPFALAFNLLVVGITIVSGKLYLKVKDTLPD